MVVTKNVEKEYISFQPLLNEISKRYNEIIISEHPQIQEMIEYLSINNGKKLRPLLVILSGLGEEAFNYSINEFNNPPIYDIIDLSLSIELIHLATLVHDDVIDNANLRRGKPTYHKKWNTSSSILFGDLVLSFAFKLCTRLNNLEIIKVLADVMNEICEGEILEHFAQNYKNINLNNYFKIIEKKTAALISASCHVGSLFAGNSKENTIRLKEFGKNLGMAFQIYDDYLDFAGDTELLGKPVLCDINNGIITLPIIHYLEIYPNNSTNGNRKEILNELTTLTNKELFDRLTASGSIEYTLNKAKMYSQNAINYLENIQSEKLKNYLINVTKMMLNRNF